MERKVIIKKSDMFSMKVDFFMLMDEKTCFINIPSLSMLLDKLHGTDEKPIIQAGVDLDSALNALEAGFSLNELIEQAKRQVEHDILEQILVVTDYNISVAAQLLNLDDCTMAAKIQFHFASHGLTHAT